MKKQLVIFFILITNFLPAAFCQQSKTVTIKAYLHAKQGIALNYLDQHNNEHGLLLKNTTGHDTLITSTINTDAKLEVQKRVYANNRGVKQSFLAKGGDVISLKIENEHMIEADNKNIFPQDYLNYIDPWTRTIKKPFKDYTDQELAAYFLECDQINTSNLAKIDSLDKSGNLSPLNKGFFIKFNEIDHYNRRLQPLWEGAAIFPRLINKYISDAEIARARTLVKTFNAYKTFEFNTILYLISGYDLYLQKIAPDNLLAAVNFIISQGYGDWGSNLALRRIFDYQDKNSPQIEQALNSLAKTTYPEQLTDINTALLAYQHRNKDIAHPERIKMVNANGAPTDLSQIYKKHKGNLVLVDLWASWCKPCRLQIPVVQHLKEKYKDKKISFVSISLDDDNAKSQWLAALKKDGNFNDAGQYRLLNGHQSNFTKFYKVSSIPRYMLLGPDGKMIAADFRHADEPEFEPELVNYLEKVK